MLIGKSPRGDAESRRGQDKSSTEGFTLVELLVVLGIIALLATMVAPQVIGYFGKARTDTAAAQIRNIESAIELYYLDVGSYPSSEAGIEALMESPAGVSGWAGPYLRKKEGLMDPWGRQYEYRFPGESGDFDLLSLGRDGREGGEGEDRDVNN
jgi:general secretion pathway protein G